MSKRIHRHVVHWVTLASVLGHVFCCGLPMAVGLLSVLAGVGTLSVMIPGLEQMHDALHHYEIPLIGFSAFMVAVGWALHFHSNKVDCHDSGCHHPPCGPQKTKASFLLWIASAIFIANILVVSFKHDAPSPTTAEIVIDE